MKSASASTLSKFLTLVTGVLLLSGAAFLFVRVAHAGGTTAKAADSSPAGPLFDDLRLTLNAKPPAQCTTSLYGTISARSPDGALCLCHQSYDGNQGFWEQIGTGRPCWPNTK
jgi:hypothetical protein